MAALPATVFSLLKFVTLPNEQSFPDDIMFVPLCGHIVDKFVSSLPTSVMTCPAMEEDCMIAPDQDEPYLRVKLSSAACHGCGATDGTRLYCSKHLRADYCVRCAETSPTLCEGETNCSAEARRITMKVRAEWRIAKVMKKSRTTVKVKWSDWDSCTWEPRKTWQPRWLLGTNIRVSTARGPL